MRYYLPSFSCFRPSVNPEIIHQEAVESHNLGDFENAKLLYEKSIELYQKKPENIPLAKIYKNLASLHFTMGNHDQAIECFTKSLKFFEKDRYSIFDISKVKLKIASCYFEKNDFHMASSCIEDALIIVDQPSFSNNNQTLVEVYSKAGNLYMKMNAKKAPQTLMESLSLPQTLMQSPSLPQAFMESPSLMDVQDSLLPNQLQECYPPSPLHAVIEDVSEHGDPKKIVLIEKENLSTEKENLSTEKENKFLSRSIDCLIKSINNSNKILFYESNYIDSYNQPKIEDAINYASNCLNLGLVFKENNNNDDALKYIDKSLIVIEDLRRVYEVINPKGEIILKTNIDKICDFVDNISISDSNLEEKKSLQKICQKLLVVVEDEGKREKINEKIKSLEDLSPPSQLMHSRVESRRLAPELSIKGNMFKKM